jgi:hypothetical protein
MKIHFLPLKWFNITILAIIVKHFFHKINLIVLWIIIE